jgi:cell wall assembly regulator SMI1
MAKTEAERVTAAWTRIEAWLKANAKPLHKRLKKPASDKAIAAAEKKLKVSLPEGVRQLYRLHNGMSASGEGSAALFNHFRWLPLAEVLESWKDWNEVLEEWGGADPEGPEANEVAKGIQVTTWSPSWIPLTNDGSGDHDCVDLAPAKGGTSGQIIRMWHDMPERTLEAKGVAPWLEALAKAIKDGELAWSEDEAALVEVK